METDELPIGQSLIAVSIVEEPEFNINELAISQIDLFFPNTKITLLPIADTDEIEIVQQADTTCTIDTPLWCQDLITKKLMAVWICDNHQGYRDMVTFAFDSLHPSIAFVAEGSVLKVFRYEQIYKSRNNELAQALLNSQQAVADTFKATLYTQVRVNH
jgi:hypothetical protein